MNLFSAESSDTLYHYLSRVMRILKGFNVYSNCYFS